MVESGVIEGEGRREWKEICDLQVKNKARVMRTMVAIGIERMNVYVYISCLLKNVN